MNLNINNFNGPLDLLLHMVKKHQMDIYEIDIKIIIDEYIKFINNIEKCDLDSKSEYLVMASELVHLKSKLLLGFDDEENDDTYEINSEDDLRNRIALYAKYQNISNDFRLLEVNRQDYFTKVPESLKEFTTESKLVGNLDVKELIKAFMDLQKRIELKKPRTTRIMKKELSVKDKTLFIKNILKDKKRVEFSELFSDISKEEMIVTFLAILEMTKGQEITIKQSNNFKKIYVEVLSE